MKVVTMRDIAKETGFSIGTVSRALKSQRGLTEDTRAVVLETARKLGYDFGQLKQRRIRRVAFLLHKQYNNIHCMPSFSPIMQGAVAACRREGVTLTHVNIDPSLSILDQLRLHAPDALLCVGLFEGELLSALRETGKPMVLVDLPSTLYSSVNPDNALGGYLATRHLIEIGRKRIAMLVGTLAHMGIFDRNRGYRRALFEAEILTDPELEISLPIGQDLERSVNHAMDSLFALPNPPDALFCFNDCSALLVLRYCLNAKIKVPHDLAVVGFGDIGSASYANPPLTSVRFSKSLLGEAGVDLLLHGDRDQLIQDVQSVELIVRESSNDESIFFPSRNPSLLISE